MLLAEIEGRPTDAAAARRFERARRDVVFDEIAASCALAGADLSPAAIRRLLERGITVAGSLEAQLLALGYARAALEIARDRRPAVAPRRLIAVQEIQRLHVTITTPLAAVRPQSTQAPAGAWRRLNLPPMRDGMVTTPHWLIEFEMAALVDRIGGAPPAAGLFLWLADAYERLQRIRPFVEGNGRVARLVANLLLARCGYPPATIVASLQSAHRRALEAADAGDRRPLADVLERALRLNLERLASAWIDPAALR
ncbi:MAG: Fic family protein, partial [Candidatus Eremiobacteraeota bacterium]|nr:Fic family protein [Candidatus Eremiobacteraeota bacterium]